MVRLLLNLKDRSKSQKWRSLFWLFLSFVSVPCYSYLALPPAFNSKHLTQNNTKQHVFWMGRFLDSELFANDLIANYFQSVAPAGYKTLQSLAATMGTNRDRSTDDCHLQVEGRFLYDANGDKVIMRGIENVVRYGQYQGSGGYWNDPYENGSLIDGNGDNVAELAKTGANATRLIGGRPDEFERALEEAIDNNLWVSIGHVDFKDKQVTETIKKYECYVTLIAQGEVVHQDENKWREDSIKAIQEMRALGYKAPIEITAGFYGQGYDMILNQGQAVFDADPLKNVVFLAQAYSEIENQGGVSANLDKFENFSVPIFVGASHFGLGLEKGYGNDSNTYKEVWDGTHTRDLSSFYWVWSDAGYGDVVSSNRKFDGLTSIGRYLVYDSPANLSFHAPKTEFLLKATP